MYMTTRGNGFSMMAFSIPPTAAKGLDPALAKLNGMQFLIQEAGGIGPLIEAVRGASDEQISLAQAQLDYAVREIEQHMLSQRVAMDNHERGLTAWNVRDARDGIGKAIEVITNDAAAAMRDCDRKPGNGRGLRLLDGVMETLAEAVVVTRAIAQASGDTRDQVNADTAQVSWGEMASQTDAFREDVGSRYSDTVHEMLRPSAEIMAAAERNAVASVRPIPELTDRRIWNAASGLRDRDILRHESRKNEVTPLGTEQAARIREQVAGLFEDYHRTFATPGFLRLLHAAAVCAHNGAERSIDRAVDPVKDDVQAKRTVEEEKNSLYGRRYGSRTVEEHTESNRIWREHARKEGEAEAAMAADYRGVVALAHQSLRPDLPVERVMRFDRDEASGVTVGRLDHAGPDDRTILIYDDAGCGNYPGAVLLISATAEQLRDGIPSLADAREAGFDLGSNYRSFGDAVSGLGNAFDRKYFLGSDFVVADAVTVPRPTNEPQYLDRLTESELAARRVGGALSEPRRGRDRKAESEEDARESTWDGPAF